MVLILIIISFLIISPNSIASLDIPILTNVQDLIGIAHDIGDIISGNIPLQGLFVKTVDPMSIVVSKIDEISEKVSNLDTKLDNVLSTILSRLPLEDSINTEMRDLQHRIARIDELYADMQYYAKNFSLYDEDTIKEFTTIITSAKEGNLPSILNKINTIIVPSKSALNRKSILDLLFKQREISEPTDWCGLDDSFQRWLLQIYMLTIVSETKAFLMTTYAYKIINEQQNKTSVGEVRRAQSGFIMRGDGYLKEFKKVMSQSSRDIFLCDPEEHVLGKNYVEFEGLFTSYVMNEYEVGNNPCSVACSDIWTWNHQRCYKMYDTNYCPKHPCKGLIKDCGWIGGDVDICEYPAEYRKRYEYIRSYSNGWYGEWTPCDNGTYKQVNGARWRFYSCNMCLCTCEESYGSSKAYRTFSMIPQITNINENKVVSNVKFTLKDAMIHIQIEEAPLTELGQLDRNASSWIPLKDFIYLSNVTGGGFVQVEDGQNIPLEKDKDFAFISRYQKTINIDQISAGPNYVLTGVRLNYESNDTFDDDEHNISPIQLEIHVTPFNYSTGELNATDENPSIWLTPKTQPKLPKEYTEKRKEIDKGYDVYRHPTGLHVPNVNPNQFVTFAKSSSHSDSGQSTIPFMDSRPVINKSNVAFDGIGLIYRGLKGFSGFIAPKLLTIDVTNYMSPIMTKKSVKYNKSLAMRSSVAKVRDN